MANALASFSSGWGYEYLFEDVAPILSDSSASAGFPFMGTETVAERGGDGIEMDVFENEEHVELSDSIGESESESSLSWNGSGSSPDSKRQLGQRRLVRRQERRALQ